MTPPLDAGAVFLTVDVEEWFHAPEHPLGADEPAWEAVPSTLPGGVDVSLTLLDRIGVKATFFVLGWAAKRFGPQVRAIAASGHEVACHGWGHRPLHTLDPESFRQELRRSREAIEDACGAEVIGYRAPRWSAGRLTWPYAVLGEEGFSYSSSRLPIPGLGGGRAGTRVVRGVVEIPALRFPRVPLPAGGTVALRILPVRLLRMARDASVARRLPAVYWFHPWELLAGAPRLEGGAFFRWARYTSLERLPKRIEELVPAGDRRLCAAFGDSAAGDEG